MLGKLIRHEWKRTWKLPALLLGLLQLIALGAGLTFLKPAFQSDFEGIIILIGVVWAAFCIAIVGAGFGVTIYLALQFYKSMYSDEGYLTHTLPVSSVQLLTAKGLVMTLWSLFSYLGIFLSIIIFGLTAMSCYPEMEWSWLLREIGNGWNELMAQMRLMGLSLADFVIPGIASALVGLFYTTALIIGSLTIGQLARKHRIPTAFLAGCVISMVVSFLQGILQLSFIYGNIFWRIRVEAEYVFSYMIKGMWMQILFYVVLTAALFAVSNYIIHKKLNLE